MDMDKYNPSLSNNSILTLPSIHIINLRRFAFASTPVRSPTLPPWFRFLPRSNHEANRLSQSPFSCLELSPQVHFRRYPHKRRDVRLVILRARVSTKISRKIRRYGNSLLVARRFLVSRNRIRIRRRRRIFRINWNFARPSIQRPRLHITYIKIV